MSGDLSRAHWVVPVHGLTPADPDGTVQAIAHRDSTVILRLTCGDFRATARLDVLRAAQLSTGIWEAAGAAQQLTGYPGDDQPLPQRRPPPPPPLLTGSGARPVTRHSLLSKDAARQATRTIGLRIHRIRKRQDKSLRIIAELAGIGKSTLHRIEHGQRELTVSEIVALASALEISPLKLIRLPILAPV